LHSASGMNRQVHGHPHERADGLGTRRLEVDPQHGPVEILDLAPGFGGTAAEQALRSRAARAADLRPGTVLPVYRIDRIGASLAIVSPAINGVLLSDLLSAMQRGTVMVNDALLLELAASVIGVVAALHETRGGFAHGAICPAHVALMPGGVRLTDAAMATVLQDLNLNREQLWRQYGLAFPSSASLPRFDQRADVTQLGAVILALLLRRPLAAGDYPRRAMDLVLDATAAQPPYGSALRMWVQQALQLHPRSVFASGADASRAFTDMMLNVGGRRAAAEALDRLVCDLCGHPSEPPAHSHRPFEAAPDLIPSRVSCGAPPSLSSSR